MIECPKCGFIQPDDRYCANCGLDIQTYKPKGTPWYLKLLKSPMFQASLSGVIILILVMSLFRSQTANIQSKISQLQTTLDQVDNEASAPTPRAASPPEQKAAPRQVVKSAPAQAAATAPLPFAEEQPAAAANDSTATVLPDTVNVLFSKLRGM